MSKKDASKAHCTGDECDVTGVAQRDNAITAGNISTAGFIAGGVLGAAGVVLVLTAPRAAQPGPQVGVGFYGPRVGIGGTW
jgi:hypothetical protein